MKEDQIQKTSIGEKIKNFRKRAGLSQLELETELGAANGSISRLEGGKVNPTKETILELGKILILNSKEISDLLGVRQLRPTEEEIQNAIDECKLYLDKDNIVAYLLDENGILYYASQGFKDLLNLSEEQVRNVIGREILELALDENLGISQFLDFEKNKRTLAIELSRISMESNIAEEYLDEVLRKYPAAAEIFSIADQITLPEVLSPDNKRVFFKVGDNRIVYSYSQEKLKQNQRFELVEYFNPIPYN